jgi:hypothetical protein
MNDPKSINELIIVQTIGSLFVLISTVYIYSIYIYIKPGTTFERCKRRKNDPVSGRTPAHSRQLFYSINDNETQQIKFTRN